jgi:hypothetical protein
MISGNLFLGTGAQQPDAFAYLMLVQLFLLWIQLIMDYMMVWMDYLRIVRSVNSKMRLAHIGYQCLLFAYDSVEDDGFTTLPLDCFVTAVAELSRESIGMINEQLILVGFLELILVALIVRVTLTSTNSTTGATAAFGLSCLAMSCLAIFFTIVYKIWAAVKQGRDVWLPNSDSEPSSDEEGEEEGGHDDKHNQKQLPPPQQPVAPPASKQPAAKKVVVDSLKPPGAAAPSRPAAKPSPKLGPRPLHESSSSSS